MKHAVLVIAISLSGLLFTSAQSDLEKIPRTSYEEAKGYVVAHLKPLETMTPQSTAIYKASYYGEAQGGIMIVWFQSNRSKGYIYERVPKRLWTAWKAAPSKGRYYNAVFKGNKVFFFELD